MKKKWVHKASSYQEMQEFEDRYYLSMSRTQRLETIQYLRELAWKLKIGVKHGQSRKGLRRVITVIQ